MSQEGQGEQGAGGGQWFPESTLFENQNMSEVQLLDPFFGLLSWAREGKVQAQGHTTRPYTADPPLHSHPSHSEERTGQHFIPTQGRAGSPWTGKKTGKSRGIIY